MLGDKLMKTAAAPESYDDSNLYGIFRSIGIDKDSGGLLPFARNDITLGAESELQVAVLGSRESVDLPLAIGESNYYRNIIKQSSRGESPQKMVSRLEKFLSDNRHQVWENSWVRIEAKTLHPRTRRRFDLDLRENRAGDGSNPFRPDAGRFNEVRNGTKWLRFPVSYLLRLSLEDWLNRSELPYSLRNTGARLQEHFINDNTSPEIISFYLSSSGEDGSAGISLARESALRLLTAQMLVEYSSSTFRLRENGQQVVVYSAPHPPVRQRQLNDIISDSFYRELFINPCIAGWERGREKYNYMILCHQTLSRSQLNGVAKMREAGIINSNLVVLPNTCNVSLANNGTHISVGSRMLTEQLTNSSGRFTRRHEKYFGDLVIKIMEHYLPLFVGTLSAAPYRTAFKDFHPERVLGFLPHQLDYTHLRMIWRRWKKKTANKFMGRALTPFGPEWLDRSLTVLLGLKGDFVPDVRLIDYLVSLMSTESSPGLDGSPGNLERLKKDLTSLGIFDPTMSVYHLYRLRESAVHGFAGFEGRHYSLFHSLENDLPRAADLQTFLTACAYRMIIEGAVTHSHIPDDPSVESERRQIFFQSAIGIPTFFVRLNTPNIFLRNLVARTPNIRPSRRYPGYIRVRVREYRQALILQLRRSYPDLVEQFGMVDTLQDLANRIAYPEQSTSARLTAGILDLAGAKSPLQVPAEQFNETAETYYRTGLRARHIADSFRLISPLIDEMDEVQRTNSFCRNVIRTTLGDQNLESFWRSARDRMLKDTIDHDLVSRILTLLLLIAHMKRNEQEQ